MIAKVQGQNYESLPLLMVFFYHCKVSSAYDIYDLTLFDVLTSYSLFQLFMQIDALYPRRFGTWSDYAKKYCNAHYK